MAEDNELKSCVVVNFDPEKTTKRWYGFYVSKPTELVMETFWRFTCPCDISVTYPLNQLPTVTTKHPCNHPEHWTVKTEE